MLPSMFSLSQRCQTDRRQCVMIRRHNALGEKINRGGTPAVTIDAALGGGTSEGGEAGVFQHGCMADEKSCGECGCGRVCHGCSKATISGEHVNHFEAAKTHHTPVSPLGGAGEH